MRVMCNGNRGRHLPPDVLARSGNTPSSMFPITIGRTYTVYAMAQRSSRIGVLIQGEDGWPSWDPIELFDVVDHRIPPGWEFGVIERDDREVLALWGYPTLIQDPTHHDALIELKRKALDEFTKERERIAALGFGALEEPPTVPTDVRIVIPTDLLERSSDGVVHGQVWIDDGSSAFPATDWPELPVDFLTHLAAATDRYNSVGRFEPEVRFLDSSFTLWVEHHADSYWRLFLFDEQQGVERQVVVAPSTWILAVSAAADMLLAECARRGWTGLDIDRLATARAPMLTGTKKWWLPAAAGNESAT